MYLCSKEISISRPGMAIPRLGMYVSGRETDIPSPEMKKNVIEKIKTANREKYYGNVYSDKAAQGHG